jgi:hypothetical protein
MAKRTMAPKNDELNQAADQLEAEERAAIEAESRPLLQDSTVGAWDDLDADVLSKELTGTWEKSPGAVLTGVISHCYQYQPKRADASGERRTVTGLAIITDRPVTARTDDGVKVVPSGSLIGVTVSKKLEPLTYYEIGSWVGIRFMGMAPMGGGQECGRYELKVKGKKRPGGAKLKATAEEHNYVEDEEVGL